MNKTTNIIFDELSTLRLPSGSWACWAMKLLIATLLAPVSTMKRTGVRLISPGT